MGISNPYYLFMIEINRTRNLRSVVVAALLLTALSGLAFSSSLHAENATGSQTITGGALSLDYVNSSNGSVSSPSLPFSNHTFSYSCTPTSSGPSTSINMASQRLQVDNSTSNSSVAVSMGLTNQTDTWTATVGGSTYRMDANDNGSSGGSTNLVSGGSSFANFNSTSAGNAFDGNINTYWESPFSNGNGAFLIGYDRGAGNAEVAISYGIVAHPSTGGPPSAWSFEGSNDGSSYTTLDSRTGQTLTYPTPSTYSFSNSTAYRYYRLRFETGSQTLQVRIGEVTINKATVGGDGCQPDGSDSDTVTGNMLADPTGITGATVSGCASTPSFTPSSLVTLTEIATSASLVTLGNVGSCKLNISGGLLRQSIPASQTPGTYTIGLTFTAV